MSQRRQFHLAFYGRVGRIGELGEQRGRKASGWPTGCRIVCALQRSERKRERAESSAGGVASSRARLGPRLRDGGYTGLEAVPHSVDPVFSHAGASRVRCDSVFD